MATSLPGVGIKSSILDCIGHTPIVRLSRIGQQLDCDLVAKCEFMNPGGSVKDRIGFQMISDAEKQGRLKAGDTIVEATSGNTGIGLALVAAAKGYNCVLTMPQKMSNEKVSVLKALGSEVVRTPNEAAWDSPESHIGVANQLVKDHPGSYHFLDQYSNGSNPRAHEIGTGEEIWEQCEGRVDMIVMATGTGGTLTGIARCLKKKNPKIIVVGVDPYGSIMHDDNAPMGSYLIEGIGYDFVPKVLDRSLVDQWEITRDQESFTAARRLIKEEGLLVGGSSGAALAGALKAAKSLTKGQRCVVLLPDSIRNYLSKFVNDAWMIEHGLSIENKKCAKKRSSEVANGNGNGKSNGQSQKKKIKHNGFQHNGALTHQHNGALTQ
jgi:cystathionine beta-synthase